MARKVAVGEGSKRGKGVRRRGEEGGKYARYSEEQIEVLEKVYAECSNPSHFQRQQIMRDHPILTGIDHTQLKVWFQNRRSREKQKKESGDLVSENRQLNAANKLLREENDGLQRKLAQLMSENENLRNQVASLTYRITTYDLGHQPEADNPQLPMSVADNARLCLLAEETSKEFLSKAIGSAIDWIPVPWLKLRSPGSVGTIYVSSTCVGVAARACVTIPFEPFKIMEILKDWTSWCRCCRNMDVVAMVPGNNGGTIELIYTQCYAPTITACARDFWTLRYTSVLDDGCLLVCEKSISGSDAAPSSPAALEFVRGRMLASGYMIRPSEGGSTIHLVDHLDLEASSVPEVVRPLYESSELVAKMIVSALHHIEHVANEKKGLQTHASREEPAFLRAFSHRLSSCLYRGFNDAVNCFSEDGWKLMNASDDLIMSIKQTKNFGVCANFDSIICVKASLLLQNVSPASLVRLLKERRSAWMNFNFASHSIAFSRAACFAYPGLNTHNLSETPVLLGHTNHEDETLEVIRFEHTADRQLNVSSEDLYHLQISNGMEDNGFGACAELIFAPIDRTMPNNAVLLSSGFRIFLLGPTTVTSSSTNLASNEAHNARNGQAVLEHAPSMLILAFQFPFQAHLLEDVAVMAQEYVRHVISSVKNISLGAKPPGSNPEMNSTESNPAMGFNSIPESTFAVNLANLICQSYRSSLGVDMLGFNCQSADSMFKQMQNHQYAIFCFSFTSLLACVYANQAALNMLETTMDNLQTLTVDRILGGSNNLLLYSILPTVIQQRYAILPPGHSLSLRNRGISYEQAVVWQVQSPDGSVDCLALAFTGWSFI